MKLNNLAFNKGNRFRINGLILLLLMFSLATQAQLNPPGDTEFTGPPSAPLDIVINVAGTVSPHTWELLPDFPFPDPLANISIIGTPPETSPTLTLQVNPAGLTVGQQYRFVVRVTDDNGVVYEERYFFIFDRQPADVIFCLDISGSMGLDAEAGCTDCKSRLQVLQAGFEGVVNAWEAINLTENPDFNTEDRVGVIYFDSDADAPPANFPLGSIVPQGAAAITDVNGRSASGATAMGAALQEAVSRLPPNPDRGQFIVLFTDGDQNRNPMVNEVTLAIEDQGGRSPASTSPTGVTLAADATIPASHIKVYTIGIGSNAGASLLDKIATDTGVDPSIVTMNDFTNDLPAEFMNILVDALRNGSPQLVGRRLGSLSGQNAIEKFIVNRGVRKILFRLSGDVNDELSFNLFKGGVDVTSALNRYYRNSNGNIIYSLDLPGLTRSYDSITAEGEWEMRIRGGNTANADYQAWCIAEEKVLNYETSLGSDFYQVGDDIEISAEMNYAGVPIDDATISVRVLKPGADIGTLLSNSSNDGSDVSFEKQNTPAEKKFLQLSNNPEFVNQLKPIVRNTFNLTNQGNGSYKGSFSDTDLSGAYYVVFTISGTHPSLGEYRREVYKSTVLNFGSLDPANSGITAQMNGNGVITAIQLQPKNTFNQLMGPGMTKYLTLKSDKGSIGTPVDNLNGSYSYPIAGLSGGDVPEISIAIFGQEEFSGQVDENGIIEQGEPSFLEELWDKHKMWILLLLLIIIIIVGLIRKSKK